MKNEKQTKGKVSRKEEKVHPLSEIVIELNFYKGNRFTDSQLAQTTAKKWTCIISKRTFTLKTTWTF